MSKRLKPRLYAKRKLRLAIPKQNAREDFELRVISEQDGRRHVVKALRNRVKQLMDDCAIDSVQGEMVVHRVAFLAARLESMECEALEGKSLDWTKYVYVFNAMTSALKQLGLKKQLRKEVESLEEYVAGKAKKKKRSKS